jgi:hypothetical protein
VPSRNGNRVARPGTAPFGFTYSLRDIDRFVPGSPVAANVGLAGGLLKVRGEIFDPHRRSRDSLGDFI